MRRIAYIVLALLLIIGSLLWLFFALLLSSINLIEVNFPIAIYLCMGAILAGAFIFKFIREGKLK
jgi:hypothetical protein